MTLSAQGAYDGFGVFFEDSQEGFGRSSRPSAALLPVLEGVFADPEPQRHNTLSFQQALCAERNERRHKNRPSAASLSRNQNQFSRQDAKNAKKTRR